MGFFRIMGQMGLNTTGFEMGLRRAHSLANTAAGKIGDDFGKKINKAFGAGAIAGLLFRPLHDAFNALFSSHGERAKGIKDHAEKLKVTAEEYQMLEAGAKAANQTVEDFVKTLQESPGGIEAAIKALQQFRNEVKLTNEDIAYATDTTFTDKLKELGQSANRLLGRFIMGPLSEFFTYKILTEGEGMSRRDAFKAMRADAAAQASMLREQSSVPSAGLKALLSEKDKLGKVGAPQSSLNSLQQIGAAYVGAVNQSPVVAAIQNLTQEVKASNQKLDKVEQAVKEGNGLSRFHGGPDWNLFGS